MKKLLLALLSLAAFDVAAQPTFTASAIPTVGQVFTTQVYDSVGVSVGPSGASQSWTFTLTPTATFSQTYVAAASTPYAAQYPNANVAANDGAGSYGYQETSATDVALWGLYTPGYQLTYTDPMIYFTLPMSYLDTYSDDFEGSYVYGGGAITAERTGSHTVTYDGYGTLALNGQTFNNVIRLHSLETYEDVTSFSTTNSTSDTYTWYGNSGSVMLLQVNWIVSDFGGGQIIATKSVTGMADPNAIQSVDNSDATLTLLGNVCGAGENALVQLNSKINGTVTFELVDMTGRIVISTRVDIKAGRNQFDLSTNGLASGVYGVRVVADNAIQIPAQKLVIR